ncbi:MAG: tetratricopeptide repeat protein [Oligoflexales bacterium]
MLTVRITLLVSLTALGLIGCKTIGSAARVEDTKEQVEVQTSFDENSTMPAFANEANTKEAVKRLKKEAEQKKSTETFLSLAQIMLIEDKLDNAEEYCKKALRYDLKNENAKKTLAKIYFRKKSFDMASIILNGLGGAGSKDSEVLNLMGLIAIEQDRKAEALAIFNEALKRNTNDVAVRMNLGVLYVKYRQLRDAGVQFERILKIMPDHTDAKLHLAIVKASGGSYDVAESIYREILASKKGNAVTLYNLAVTKNNQQNYDEAIKILKAYLDTPYAKKSANTEVFALIDSIRDKQQMNEKDAVSDAEIQSLAAKVAPEERATKETETQEATTAQPGDDEIENLESQLK